MPLGSTEQHAYLSLGTDSILAERVAAEAAEPRGMPVFLVFAGVALPQEGEPGFLRGERPLIGVELRAAEGWE